MFGIDVQITDTTNRVKDAADRAAYRNVQRSAFLLRQDAVASIKVADGPSSPGSPPHTHTARITKSGKLHKGQFQRAIVYQADRQRLDAVIGPRFSVVGLSFEAHEKGKEFKGDDFVPRPTMGPALDRNLAQFGNSFSGSIGQ